jgi:carbon-monoxide dehydrogenase large subunit
VSVPRVEGYEKVTGVAKFVDDIQFGPGLLYARLLRSPYPHALIKRIDTTKAEELPGVRLVVTGQDFPGYIGLYLKDRHLFARGRVRFVGEPVAGVVATSELIAEQALGLIEVEYEELPGIFDPEAGVKPDAILIHPDLGSYEVAPFIFPVPGTNVSNHFQIRKGDVEAAFARCDVVVEGSYYVPQIQHVPLEPHVAVALAEPNGKITLWASSQSPFAQRNLIAKSLDISHGDLRVITPFVGGGFGSKAGVSVEGTVVAMAMKLPGRPIKLRCTREEEFFTTFVRQGMKSYIKMGATRDGKILVADMTFYWDGGAYTEYGVNITRAAGYSSSGPYEIPNLKADSYCVYTNHPVGGPLRGFGMSEMHFGIEQHVDVLAEKLGISPVEMRLKNCLREGSIVPTGSKMHPTGLPICIEKAAQAIDFEHKAPPSAPHKRRGKGMAAMWKAPAMPPNAGSSAWVKLNEDGTVTVGIGGIDMGQGTVTMAAQMAAAALGVPVEKVKISPVDTDYSPYEWQTVASRLTWSMGNAIVAAAREARRQIIETAARAWQEDPADLDIVDGEVISYKTEESLSLQDLVVYGLPTDEGWVGGPVVGRGSFMPSYVTGLDKETGQGERAVVHYTTGAQAVELEVDTETGRIEIVRMTAAFDVGKAINPDMVKGQMEGGAVQGLSTAIFEQLVLENGQPRNPSLVDYRIATSADAPRDIEAIIVEVPQDDGPWGARGIGEHAMVPTAPAIANAIYDAVGIRLTSLPLTAEKIFLAMQG